MHTPPCLVGTQQLPLLDADNFFVTRLFTLKLFATDASFKTHRKSCFTLVLELLQQSCEVSYPAVGYQLVASLPLKTCGSSPMAKLNTNQLALVAFPSSSTISSTCFYAPSLLEAPAPLGAYANGPKSEYADSPHPEHVTSHRQASSFLHYAFSWLHYLPAFVENQDLTSTPLILKVPRCSLKHVVGKDGHMMARIDNHWGFLHFGV